VHSLNVRYLRGSDRRLKAPPTQRTPAGPGTARTRIARESQNDDVMQFACEKCGTRYAVPDEKVRGKRIRTKCRKCGSEILVEGPPGPPGPSSNRATTSVSLIARPETQSVAARRPASTSAAPNRGEERWTVALSRTNRRRMTTAELVQGYASGAVSNEALIWKAGMEEWQSPFDIPALALALQARGFARPAVVPSAQKEPQGSEHPPIPSADAADWDEEAATRVADATISFPGRPSRASVDAQGAVPEAYNGAAKADPVKVEPHWDEEDDEETTALPQDGASQAPPPEAQAIRGKPPIDFDDEATEVIAPDRARELLAAESSKQKTLPPPPGAKNAFDDDEATQVIGEARAEALLAAHATPHVGTASPSPEPREQKPSARPVQKVPKAPPVASLPKRQPGTYGAPPLPARSSLQPPRPRGATSPVPPPLAEEAAEAAEEAAAEAVTEPLPPAEPLAVAVPVEERPPAPKPAAGVPPLASLAPPKPSSFPPAGATGVAPPPDPQHPAEPTVVVAEPKPLRKPLEAALQTMPRLRPPSPPPQAAIRTIQNERTRVVRVVNKGPGVAFWVMLTLALAAAAAGGFVVSQMLRDRGAPGWLKKP
jgi:predicted Zn finger-like uncharacterized protein